MRHRPALTGPVLAVSLAVSGCGTHAPGLQGSASESAKLVRAVAYAVHCEIKNAVSLVIDEDRKIEAARGERTAPWFENWGVLYSLTFSVEENTTVNPTLSVLSPASVVGGGGNWSATATRESKMNFYFTVKELYDSPPCKALSDLTYRERSFLISDHLGLGDWLRDYILVVETGAGNAPTDNATPLSTGAITDHIRFEVVAGTSITPAWGLARVDVNKGGTLFSTSRDGVHDLLITYGPVDPNTGRLVGSANDQFLASQIGTAVDDATP